MEDSADIELYE